MNNELTHTRTITGWSVCVAYKKLNNVKRKDHFPLPFIDQMLKRLANHKYSCISMVIVLDSDTSSRSIKNYIYMSFWDICIHEYACWFL